MSLGAGTYVYRPPTYRLEVYRDGAWHDVPISGVLVLRRSIEEPEGDLHHRGALVEPPFRLWRYPSDPVGRPELVHCASGWPA